MTLDMHTFPRLCFLIHPLHGCVLLCIEHFQTVELSRRFSRYAGAGAGATADHKAVFQFCIPIIFSFQTDLFRRQLIWTVASARISISAGIRVRWKRLWRISPSLTHSPRGRSRRLRAPPRSVRSGRRESVRIRGWRSGEDCRMVGIRNPDSAPNQFQRLGDMISVEVQGFSWQRGWPQWSTQRVSWKHRSIIRRLNNDRCGHLHPEKISSNSWQDNYQSQFESLFQKRTTSINKNSAYHKIEYLLLFIHFVK